MADFSSLMFELEQLRAEIEKEDLPLEIVLKKQQRAHEVAIKLHNSLKGENAK